MSVVYLTYEEACERLKPFGITIEKNLDFDGEVYGYDFYTAGNKWMMKPDGYDCAGVTPSDFNMAIDGCL